jgi:MFS transporter, DHA1 family, multidrug resistance protein
MQAGKQLKAEDRLPLAMVGGILFAITMFWFAWTANFNSIHWIVPTLAGTFLSTSILLIFVAYLNYLTDTYLMYTASAMAANTICRSACGAAAPLFTNQMFSALGVGGGGSLIGGVAVLLAPIPFVFYKYGESIRVKSRFAPTDMGKQEKKADDEEKQAGNTSGSSSSGGEEEEKKVVPDEPRREGSMSSSSDEELELGADYESREELERRAEDRRERQRVEMERSKTQSDAGE